ncbi:MAG: 50S ribosome-binding GTPase [Candidatus Lokiarchaeota archaeon]|nr:50S ribosome-binding GTPase [Candidatus Lokiarchaeota archaeon]
MSDDESISKIKDFFKTGVLIPDELDEILNLKPESLIGVDQINSDKLLDRNIKSIGDLASLDPENPPEIKELSNHILIKWIKISRVLEKVVREQIRKQKKIVLIGLDNGGKTSILAVIQDRFSIIKSLLPTKGVQREKLDFFGFPIISWDLGGQVQYRDKYYFNKPELFFTEVDLVLYVIDTQDPSRFNEAAEYFRQVLTALKDLDEQPPVLAVLNKSDQDIRKTLQWQKNKTDIVNKIDLVAKEFQGIVVEYCDTTIFQKESIMQMFSIALKKVSETSEIIENILEDFTRTIEAKAASLISMDGLIFGNYTKNSTDEMLINNTALLLQTLSNFHTSIGLIREKSISLDFPLNGFSISGEKLFEYSDLQIPVFLWVLTSNLELVYDKLEYFKEQLMPLINMFL